MGEVNQPDILLLSLAFQSYFDETYASLIDKLSILSRLKRAKSISGAINYLDANNPKAILVTDEGLTETENRVVRERIVSYVRKGGLIIVGLHFPNFVTMDAFDGFFNETFDLPWTRGGYDRTDFQLNHSSSLPSGITKNGLPGPYSMKALRVNNARPHEKIYIPVEDAMTQSLVFPASYVNQAQAAVVGSKIGDGYLVYIGDVNAEKGSFDVILSLCGF